VSLEPFIPRKKFLKVWTAQKIPRKSFMNI
jgi:hypothetical protein